MIELLTMWKNTRMIVLVAFVAALYAATRIPFSVIPIIPGFTEARPATAFPPTFSLLFGPASAWGTGIGNIIADMMSGQFGPGSAFGFIGNFLLGLIPYALWGRLRPLSVGGPPTMRDRRQWVEYAVIVLISSAACAVVIGYGTDVLRLFPFAVLGNIILINNLIFGLLGIPLLALLYRRVERWGLLWTDIMPPSDVSSGPGRLGALLFAVGALGAAVAGNVLSLGVLKASPLGAGFAQSGDLAYVGTALVMWGAAPFILCLVLGVLLGSGAPAKRELSDRPGS